MSEQDRRAAARKEHALILIENALIENQNHDRSLQVEAVYDYLRIAGLLTAPDAPGTVCISRETANWASWALTGVLADNPEATVVPAVREARDEIYAAIEAAAEGGPGERGEGDVTQWYPPIAPEDLIGGEQEKTQ